MVGLVFTCGTVRFLRKALEGFGFVSTFAFKLGGDGFCRWVR